MTNQVEYIKVSQLSKREFEVICVQDGDCVVDASYKTSVQAENRAIKLAKQCNCDWSTDY